jgi:flagellar hook protein FlgE
MASSALYSAISGLQANSSWLDVIGNNISNSNTTSFKSQSMSFASSLTQTLSGGAGDNSENGLGGVDPEQIGTGTRVQAISANWTEGTLQSTGVNTDVAITGTGFLISKSGSNTYLTRAGNLTFDSQGNLVDANGGLIQGYTSSLNYSQRMIDPAADTGTGVALQITTGSFNLNDTDLSAIGNININPNLTLIPKATTQINFSGNLDAAQQANAPTGGVLQQWQGPAANQNPVLPTGLAGVIYNPGTLTLNAQGEYQQTVNLSLPNGATNLPQPIVSSTVVGSNLNDVRAADTGSYAWEQQPPLTPAMTSQETVYDSNGNPRTITVLFYQVNDLGAAGVNTGPSQAVYAWYAFDTTGGLPASTTNLLGGTAINEGEMNNVAHYSFHRNSPADAYAGDFLFFNTDGSLASTGGSNVDMDTMAIPAIYLPPFNQPSGLPSPASGINGALPVSPLPTQGAEITQIFLNFGTAGILGTGERDGLTSDAQGTYQTINGVNTYVPDSHSTVTQDGYTDGTLTGLAFDSTGKIDGTFSNGQTVALAQVAMATVENPGGLNSVGRNYYSLSPNTGAETIGLAGSNGMGIITGGSLEGSNVDLTVELSNMIIAQRGFEVNARVITVDSQNLQTLTQLGQ